MPITGASMGLLPPGTELPPPGVVSSAGGVPASPEGAENSVDSEDSTGGPDGSSGEDSPPEVSLELSSGWETGGLSGVSDEGLLEVPAEEEGREEGVLEGTGFGST